MTVATFAYVATLAGMFAGWRLYWELEDDLRDAIGVFMTFVGFVLVFGPPALAARAAYMRVMSSTPTQPRVYPPDRPRTF
jgi:uncharacterized membrane protein YfcA